MNIEQNDGFSSQKQKTGISYKARHMLKLNINYVMKFMANDSLQTGKVTPYNTLKH